MIKNTKPDSELFFWVKSGDEVKIKSIHSIHSKQRVSQKIKLVNNKAQSDTDTTHAGLKPGWIRATLIVREVNLAKIKAFAYWERKNIKDVMDEALAAYLETKEIKPLSEDKI